MKRRLIVAFASAFVAMQAVSLLEAGDAIGRVAADPEAPAFVKEQWAAMAAKTWFPLTKRDWPAVGLPKGLDEQVWKAQAPDAEKTWRNISPGYANVIYDAKVDNGTVTVILDGAGLAQSNDGGASWRQISHHLTAPAYGYYSFDISPADPRLIVVAGSALDRSSDGGRSWSEIYDKALPPFSWGAKTSFGQVRFNADGSRLFASLGAFGHMLEPRSDLEAKMAEGSGRKLIYAGDASASNFKALDLGPFAGVRCLLPHPSNPDLVYASFSDGSIYAARNARAETPSFVRLALPERLAKFQAICMDVSPVVQGELLLAMMDSSAKPRAFKLVLAKERGDALDCEDVPVKDEKGAALLKPSDILASAKWNPRLPRQVFVGVQNLNKILVSEDGMASFKAMPFPQALKHDEPDAAQNTFYSDPHKFAFDPKSDLAVTWSCIGAWSSRDQFKSLEDLLMTYDENGRLYGNKGVGFAECAVSICARDKFTYIATNDHGAFRSDGADCSKWRRISLNPGMPLKNGGKRWATLTFPMGVSFDEKTVYLIGRLGEPENNPYSSKKLKLLLSTDQGDSWQDVTRRLGKGDVLELDQKVTQFLFDPSDPSKQWILLENTLFRSLDGGLSFQETDLSTFKAPWLKIAYDPAHGTLYGATGKGVMRSLDFGSTWSKLPFKLNAEYVFSVGVLDGGDLVIGAEGRLIVAPFSKIEAGIIEPGMVRMTIGDTVESYASGQRAFHPIFCDGKDILVFSNNGFQRSNCERDLGPLLSRDGGKSFQWLVYDLPCLEGANAEMRNGRIVIGNRGIYEMRLK